MKIGIKLICAGIILCGSISASAQQLDPLQKALLNTYEQLLQENPKDFQTYFERGSMYYSMGLYDKAMNDLIKAVQYTPKKETQYLAQVLSTLSDVNNEVGNYTKALQVIDEALQIQPNSYVNLYKKGNILLSLNLPDDALAVFRSMQSLKSRSQEAYFGMAKAMILKENYSEVEDLIKEIEKADPSNFNTFCRIGDLYCDMGKDEEATANYLSAFALTDSSSRPLSSLRRMAQRNYPAFNGALQYALSRTQNKLPLYLVGGNLALSTGNYSYARDLLIDLSQLPQGNDAYVYAMLAETELGMNRLDEAYKNINKSIEMQPEANAYSVKSKIETAQGNYSAAIISAQKALQLRPSDLNALLAKASAEIAAGNGKSAKTTLNEAVITYPDNALPLLLRGYVNDVMLKDKQSAKIDYTRASDLDCSEFPQAAYVAIAKASNGKMIDAEDIVQRALKNGGSKDDYFYAALYYSQTGNVEKGKEMLQRAKTLGYQDLYQLEKNNIGNINITKLR